MAGLGQALTLLSLMWQACTQNPQNMQQCLTNHDQWLWPEIQRGWRIYTGKEQPYATENTTADLRKTHSHKRESVCWDTLLVVSPNSQIKGKYSHSSGSQRIKFDHVPQLVSVDACKAQSHE